MRRPGLCRRPHADPSPLPPHPRPPFQLVAATCTRSTTNHIVESPASSLSHPHLHPPQLASSCFGPADAEHLREHILAGGSGTEPFSPTVRLGDSVLRVPHLPTNQPTNQPTNPLPSCFPSSHSRHKHRSCRYPDLFVVARVCSQTCFSPGPVISAVLLPTAPQAPEATDHVRPDNRCTAGLRFPRPADATMGFISDRR